MRAATQGERAGTLRRFKPYPAYKDSGVEWLGEVPAHWEVSRADAFLRYEKLQIEPSEISEELVFHYSIPSVQDTGDGALEPPSEIDSAKLLIVGDRLLVSKLNPRKGVVFIATEKDVPTMCSTEFVPFEVRGCDLRWSMYLFLAESTRQRLSAVVRSATRSHQRAEISEIVKIWHGVPAEPEQRAIAAFLDQETARIDGLVGRKERLIELLQEKRTALITRAVTRGLDPNVRMKDSGVEWLGEIPVRWDVRPLKSVSALQTGLTLGKRYNGGALATRPYLRVANVQDGYLSLDDIAEVKLPERDASRYELRVGDVLMTEGGDFDKLGRGHVWEGQIVGCLHQNHIFAVRPRRDVLNPRFLALAMGSGYGRAYFTATSKQSTNLASTNSTKLRNLPMAMPDLSEQNQIIATTDRETARIDTLVAKVREAIDRLKELRTALISAAVTGKIDLREEVA